MVAQAEIAIGAEIAGLLTAGFALVYAAAVNVRKGEGPRVRRRRMRRHVRDGMRNQDGGAAVEFALVSPLLVMLMMGIITYGGWLWMAQSVETLAGEAARAAIAGLSPSEREALAREEVSRQAPRIMGVSPNLLQVSVTSDAQRVEVRIDYDVSTHPLQALRGLTPSPPAHIARTAVVRMGGY